MCRKLGVSEGDKLDVFEHGGAIYMLPVVVYPQKYLDELGGELNVVKNRFRRTAFFDNVDALFEKLESD